DPMGTTAVPQGGHWIYVVPGGRDYLLSLVGYHVQNKDTGRWLQCAGTIQVLAGAYGSDGNWHDAARTRFSATSPNWFRGDVLSPSTPIGTMVASNWAPDGSYPNDSTGQNHTLSFAGRDPNGGYDLISAQENQPIKKTVVSADELSNYYTVNV